MQTIYKYWQLLLITLCLTILSCKKFLDEKPLVGQSIPNTTKDLQALLDNPLVHKSDPALLGVFSDEYYVTSDYLNNADPELLTNYIWATDAIPYNISWNQPYMGPIYYSNIVLDHLPNLTGQVNPIFGQIKGAALFYRANAFFNLLQLYAKPYDQSTLSDLGIVLRNTSDINIKSTRATIGECYNKIIFDLKEAIDLLPNHTELQTRPTKSAANAALARVYLNMRDYDNAFKFANSALQAPIILLDFNTLIPGVPVEIFNPEVIFHSETYSPILNSPSAKIDPILYETYSQNDLRRSIFFQPNVGADVGTFSYRGSYLGSEDPGGVFVGTTTAEMLLIRAECYARKGEKINSINDINVLLSKRMDKNSWLQIDPLTVSNPLNLVLSERRKELVFRGLRWMDIRRLNMEGANITLKRLVNNIEYTLPPNDNRGVALIPYDVINRAGIQQNPR